MGKDAAKFFTSVAMVAILFNIPSFASGDGSRKTPSPQYSPQHPPNSQRASDQNQSDANVPGLRPIEVRTRRGIVKDGDECREPVKGELGDFHHRVDQWLRIERVAGAPTQRVDKSGRVTHELKEAGFFVYYPIYQFGVREKGTRERVFLRANHLGPKAIRSVRMLPLLHCGQPVIDCRTNCPVMVPVVTDTVVCPPVVHVDGETVLREIVYEDTCSLLPRLRRVFIADASGTKTIDDVINLIDEEIEDFYAPVSVNGSNVIVSQYGAFISPRVRRTR